MQSLPMYPASPVEPDEPPPAWIAYAELLRLPAALVAMALTLAGALLAGARLPTLPALLPALFGSAGLVAAFGAFNDLFDLQADRRAHPQRPLPAHRVPLERARFLAWATLLGALLLCAVAGVATLLIGVGIGLARAGYEAGGQRMAALAFLLPALAFTGALWLGIAVVPEAALRYRLPLAAVFLYGASVSVLHAARAGRLALPGALFISQVHLLSALALLLYQALGSAFTEAMAAVPFLVVVIATSLPFLARAQPLPTPGRLQAVERLLSLAAIWLGASLAAGYAGAGAGALVGAFYVVGLFLAQRVPLR